MDLGMGKEFGKKMEKTKTQMYMKESTSMIKNVVTEFINGVQAISTRVIFLMITGMVTVRCFGTMEVIIKECGRKAISVVKEK